MRRPDGLHSEEPVRGDVSATAGVVPARELDGAASMDNCAGEFSALINAKGCADPELAADTGGSVSDHSRFPGRIRGPGR